MLYQNVRIFGAHLRILDALFLGLTSFVGFGFLLDVIGSTPPPIADQALYVLALVLSFLMLSRRVRTYHVRRTESLLSELLILGEVTLYSVALAAFFCIALVPALGREEVVLVSSANIALLLLFRAAVRLLIRSLRARGKDYRVWLIIGSGRRTSALQETIAANPHFGVRILDVVDLKKKGEADTSSDDKEKLIALQDIRQIVQENVVDEVVVTLPVRSYYDEIRDLIKICTEAGITIKLPTDTFDLERFSSEIVMTGDIPFVNHFTGPSNYSQLAMKRLLDVAGALVGLIVLSPLFIVVALAIKLDSKGPAIYWASRIGLHGRPIRIAKFRTMVQDADDLRAALRPLAENTLAFKIKDDPRITRVGKFLRQYHIDELPQIWNVLLGEMSLVGPRPLPPDEASGEAWWHRRRLSMLPGMTCYWQVTGDHQMPFDEWAQLDLQYIDNWSLWVDIKLIFATVLAMFRKQGW